MGKEILTFGNIEIGKIKFYHNKIPIFWGDVDIEKTLLSNGISFGESTLLVTCIKVIKLNHLI